MSRGCGKYLTSNIFGVLTLAIDGVHQSFSTTNGVATISKQSQSQFNLVLWNLEPCHFIHRLMGVEWRL